MITINVTPAKRRFGLKPRKQWQFQITTGNKKPIDPRDTYANVGDIHAIWDRIVGGSETVQIVVHYADGPKTTILRPGEAS